MSLQFSTLAAELAHCFTAWRNCAESGNAEWLARWRERMAEIEADYLPSGSGLDSGVKLDTDRSKPESLVFSAPFHAMDSNGFYDGWRELRVTVRPSFVHGIIVDVTGRADESIKDYVAGVMCEALRTSRAAWDKRRQQWAEAARAREDARAATVAEWLAGGATLPQANEASYRAADAASSAYWAAARAVEAEG